MHTTFKLRALLTSLTFLVGMGSIPAGLVGAQADPFDVAISPPVAYVQVKPGQTITHTVVLEQQGSQVLTISPSLVDFSPGTTDVPTTTSPVVLNDTHTFPYLATPDKPLGDSFELKPGEKKRAALPIVIPADAPEREYHLTLLFTGTPSQSFTIGSAQDASQAQVSGIVASNLVLLVSNSTTDRGQLNLKSLKLPKVMDSLAPLDFSVLAENTGGQATVASGSALITDPRGQVVANFPLYPDRVLAHSTRQLRASGADHNPTVFRYDPWFLLGTYTVTITMNTNTSQNAQQLATNQTIFAFPFSLVGATVALVLVYISYRLMIAKMTIVPPEKKL